MRRAALPGLVVALATVTLIAGFAVSGAASSTNAGHVQSKGTVLASWRSAQGFSATCAEGVECLLWGATATTQLDGTTFLVLIAWHPGSAAPTPVSIPSFRGTITGIQCVPHAVCTADVQRSGPHLVFGSGGGVETGRQVEYDGVFVADPRTNAWRRVSLPSNLLSAVTCLTLTRCVQVLSGAVAATDDAGRRWSVRRLPEGFSFGLNGTATALSCVSATTCLALGTEQSSPMTVAKPAILRTTDAGKTWQVLSSPIAAWTLACALKVCLETTFAGALQSADGGTSWHQVRIPSGDTAQDLTCWTVNRCVEMTANGGVIESDDDGARWSPLPGPDYNDAISTACASTAACVLLGADNLGAMWPSITTNGGSTWVPLAVPVALTVSQLACETATTCTALVDNRPVLQLNSLNSQLIQDRSALVDFSPSHPGGSWLHVEPLDATYEGIVCAATRCVVVGSRIDARTDREVGLALVRSGDGPWRKVGLPAGTGPLRGLSCVGNRCVAAGTTLSGRILFLRSSDAGLRWAGASSPRIPLIVLGVSCVAATCLADGTKNLLQYQWPVAVLRSTDAGATWKVVQRGAGGSSSSGSIEPIGLQCVTSSTCYLPANEGLNASGLLKTTDGGVRWSWISPDGYAGATSGVVCTPFGRCAVGAIGSSGPGVLLVSPHAGAAWTVTAAVRSAQVTAVWCPSSTRCLFGATASAGNSAIVAIRLTG